MSAPHDYHLLHSSLTFAVVLFVLGAAGFAARRNAVVMFFSAAIMLQGMALTWCALGTFHGDAAGRTAGMLVLVLTAGAAIVTAALAKQQLARGGTLDVSRWREADDGGDSHENKSHGGTGAPVPREAAHE